MEILRKYRDAKRVPGMRRGEVGKSKVFAAKLHSAVLHSKEVARVGRTLEE